MLRQQKQRGRCVSQEHAGAASKGQHHGPACAPGPASPGQPGPLALLLVGRLLHRRSGRRAAGPRHAAHPRLFGRLRSRQHRLCRGAQRPLPRAALRRAAPRTAAQSAGGWYPGTAPRCMCSWEQRPPSSSGCPPRALPPAC
jgi:hypothetical protein